MKFKLKSNFKPSGDQPKAIKSIIKNFDNGQKRQVLLGATGTGKTFTMANVIEKVQKPTLILAHNKTLASQLYGELKELFPDNRVEYFVSYFDYYQPESYLPHTDTYIEKDSKINEDIDRLRHSATASLLERDDVIVVSSVSCIYGLGNPNEYKKLVLSMRTGDKMSRENLMRKLINIQYTRNDTELKRGTFRVRGDSVEIIPAYSEKKSLRINFWGDEIEEMFLIDSLTGNREKILNHLEIWPATHYITEHEKMIKTLKTIEKDMQNEVSAFQKANKLIEAQRLEQRTKYDLEMMQETGYCSGIENYTRYFTGLKAGEATYSLLDYFPKDFIMFIDESHVTIPQVGAMYNGDRARKEKLVEYGFRLKAALDNRPLKFTEFDQKLNKVLYVSATPNNYEIEVSNDTVVEQIIRPTGLIDPIIEVRPKENQVDNIIQEIKENVKRQEKMLITTLTKKMAEDLTTYLTEYEIKVAYLHSDIKTLERIKIINELRSGKYDVLIGINLLREGLDIPEVSRVLILDADKEGFLRSKTSLIQTIGRAARNSSGKVIMYADNMTNSMEGAIEETKRRRKIQEDFNKKHGITPMTINKKINTELNIDEITKPAKTKKAKSERIKQLEEEMQRAADNMDFETAAMIRDILYEEKGK